GIYSALDYTRGRIFTYDSEGNILYIFGGMGSELGMFKQPVAIESFNDNIYVLDQQRGAVIMFEPTRYGELINQAIGLRYDGAESEAVKLWEEVLKLDAHYELAYSGIGKSLLAAGKNKEAVEYLKKGMNKRYYSVAFKRLRNDFLKENINIVAAIIIIIILIPIAVKTVKFVRERKYRKRW
ncbi:MAG: gluconolactonase, partial [Oscillospiraceae bacterium]|nr:gluconolactonase [Oscillospiraceae bacterium]